MLMNGVQVSTTSRRCGGYEMIERDWFLRGRDFDFVSMQSASLVNVPVIMANVNLSWVSVL